MVMAVGPAASPPADGVTPPPPVMGNGTMSMPMPMTVVPDAAAKDAIIGWYRGEFAAANAIIDALCGHLTQLSGGGGEYGAVFAAVHRRRMNWIPVLQMQKYHSIADVMVEVRNLGAKMAETTEKKESHSLHENNGDGDVGEEMNENCKSSEGAKSCVEDEKMAEESDGNDVTAAAEAVTEDDGSPESDITDSGSQEVLNSMNNEICSNHDDCEARRIRIKLTKGFSAKESVKGHMVNVVKGLKLYEEIFSESELSKLIDFANDLRAAGLNGELSGETFILFNKQIKGNKREMIQFGIPIFGHVKEDPASNIGSIPPLLHDVIDHLVLWQLIPQYKRPNGCIINFFEEGEYSQPFLKPPHLDQPISTLLLSESTMAFGRTLVTDTDGNYKGPLTLSLKEGSLLVMRGNSADMARHVMCPSLNKRISITFFRVRVDSNQFQSSPHSPTQNGAMTVWQPGMVSPFAAPDGAPNGYESMDAMSKWGVLRAPMVMLAPVLPMVMSPRKLPQSGTGVFLPWTVGSRKPAKHLPPRAQKGRLMSHPSPVETHVVESTSEPGITV